ncbi:DUF4360 domain-containing protein [Streptomyces sp. NPDC005963]|uniref:DUF4360 domain-containing protein n=1 Tax=Streptomyces sp. NPDC005963 TaxID=3156721 RepID=UPI00340D4C42
MSRALFASGAAAAILASLLGASNASAKTVTFAAPPEKITIDIATINGSGCHPGTAAVAVSEDNTAFTVTYSDYLAKVGVGASPTDFRKNCQLSLVLHVPQGFTYAIASTDYRGFASLEPTAIGTQKASYYFQGSPVTASRTHNFRGPLNDNWQATNSTEWGQLVWAPCGVKRNFNVNTELRVSPGLSDRTKTTSFMAMDSTDGAIDTVYRLAWKECP